MSTKKSEVFALRMSESEAENLRRAARAAGSKPATWARERLIATVAGAVADTPSPRKPAPIAKFKHSEPIAPVDLPVYHVDDLGEDPLRHETGALRK